MPSKLIVRDWQQIRRWLEPRIAADQVRLVSVDIFDTILSRCIEPPSDVQYAVCRKIAQRLHLDVEIVWQTR